MNIQRPRNFENQLPVKFKMADGAQIFKFLNRYNSPRIVRFCSNLVRGCVIGPRTAV